MEIFGRKTVILTRFRSVFVASVVSMVSAYVAMSTDNVVAGQLVGKDAVAAMTVVFPIFTLILFVAYLIADGLVMMASFAQGREDRAEVNRLFSLGIILSAVCSVVFFAGLVLLREEILSLWEVSAELKGFAGEYYDGLKFLALFQFVSIFLYTIFTAEGKENECVKAAALTFVVNVVLDVVLCREIGVEGIGLATTIGTAAGLIVLLYYLTGGRSDLHFGWYWDSKKAWQGVFYSFYHSVDTLCLSILPLLLSYLVIKFFGEADLIIVTVAVNLLVLIIAVYTGLVDCLQPMVCQYHAEGNLHSVVKTMRVGLLATVLVSLAMTVLGMVFADFLPAVFGVEEPELAARAAVAMRYFLPFTTFLGLTLILSNYYIYIEELNFGAAIKFLLLLILPSVGAVAGGGFTTNIFWLAVGASFAVSFVLVRILVRFVKGSAGLLLVDGAEYARQLSYDVDATREEVLALTRRAEADLERLGVGRRVRNKLVLFIEEFGLHAAERAGAEAFQLEFSILLGEGDSATLIIRDNGEPCDIVKVAREGNFSFREFFIEGVTTNVVSHSYVASGDENRVVMRI